MECISSNKIKSVTFDSEDPNYPWINTLDEHPKQWGSSNPASGTPEVATVEFTVGTGSRAFGLFNTNAKEIIYTLYDKDDVLVETVTFDLASAKTYEEFLSGEVEEIWTFVYHHYPYQIGDHKIKLELTGDTTGQPVHIGVIRAGTTKNFINPSVGIQESLVDYSIEQSTNNGSFYYEKREIVRRFTGNLRLSVEKELYVMMLNLGRDIGKQPLAWQITDITGNKWTVYARFDTLPGAVHDNSGYGTVSFSILEVI